MYCPSAYTHFPQWSWHYWKCLRKSSFGVAVRPVVTLHLFILWTKDNDIWVKFWDSHITSSYTESEVYNAVAEDIFHFVLQQKLVYYEEGVIRHTVVVHNWIIPSFFGRFPLNGIPLTLQNFEIKSIIQWSSNRANSQCTTPKLLKTMINMIFCWKFWAVAFFVR